MSAANPLPTAPATRDPDLDKDIHDLIQEVLPYFIEDVDGWLRTPNPKFDFARPIDAIGTPRESILRNMLRAAKQGAIS